jgi:hypothetical protein
MSLIKKFRTLSIHCSLLALVSTGAVVADEDILDTDSVLSEIVEPESPPDYGIAQGIAIGITGRSGLLIEKNNISPWGLSLFSVFPISNQSQLRVQLGMPASKSGLMMKKKLDKDPDVQGSLEFEWGQKYFGITAGAAASVMQAFDGVATTNSDLYFDTPDTILHHFDRVVTANWIIGIRGGRPDRGFRGFIAWPMPFIYDYTDGASNSGVVDYSAMGCFGSKTVKLGVGVRGNWRFRQFDSTGVDQDYSYDTSTVTYEYNEGFAMAPCFKAAIKIKESNVLSLSLSLLRLFFPDVTDSGMLLSDQISLTIVHSFKPIRGTSVMDGTF